MRNFDETDRKKKSVRISLPDNPGNLSKETLSQLKSAVETAMKDGYVACPSAWKVAKDIGVSRLDVGVMIDKLGIRVTACQLGCFSVSKTSRIGTATAPFSEEVACRVETLREKDELTCASVFDLARELKVKPMSVADVANARGYKLRKCQLGCF